MSQQLSLSGASQSVSPPKIGIVRSLARCSKLTKFALVPAASNTHSVEAIAVLVYRGMFLFKVNVAFCSMVLFLCGAILCVANP